MIPMSMPPYKDGRQGRNLGEEADGDPLTPYPNNYPIGADTEVQHSIDGKTENEKTFNQGDDYWSDRGKGPGGLWNEDKGESLDEKQK
jgi:hypothetical protein